MAVGPPPTRCAREMIALVPAETWTATVTM